ncbi:hypothetical protein [Campylobacter sp.]|uniref:hypothetical protein n=1 Tax=Campylobacter sp. TaxID=205 RepID=UPI002710E9DD|nr:hypothetical protein [Campylobacter sp.]
MRLKIQKPRNEDEFVNLYGDVSEAINAMDKNFHDYMLEPNIMDDKDFEEIAEFLNSYYAEVRGMNLQIVSEDDRSWEIEIS